VVIVVHGIGSSKSIMWPLAKWIERPGLKSCLWGYSTLFRPIDDHAQALFRYLSSLSETFESLGTRGPSCSFLQQGSMQSNRCAIHIVAHSMGAIVARRAVAQGDLPRLGRMVLLAPPNAGSPVAHIASKAFGFLSTPTRELSHQSDSFVKRLPHRVPCDVGVIAAKYDLLVPLWSTGLEGMKDYLVVAATHNSLLLSRYVAEQTVEFLRNGTFRCASDRSNLEGIPTE